MKDKVNKVSSQEQEIKRYNKEQTKWAKRQARWNAWKNKPRYATALELLEVYGAK